MSADPPLLRGAPAWPAAVVLAFTAGGVDAIGLSAVARFTAHMSGTTSGLADALFVADLRLIGLCAVALVSFVAGAAATGAVMAGGFGWAPLARARALLIGEAVLLALAVAPLQLGPHAAFHVAAVVAPFAAAMGAQNRIGVILAGGSARTTHVTGTLTDAGYHLGRMLSSPAGRSGEEARSAGALFLLFIAFAAGGVSGRAAWRIVGPASAALMATLPLALALLTLRAQTGTAMLKP
ncbi:MAG: DUF1275 domain-containing protein [Caulobacteraceae bacterium]|nr:DUF1275 domain-containing protein [Caulobacter sp.]